jgi:hypothetical protein
MLNEIEQKAPACYLQPPAFRFCAQADGTHTIRRILKVAGAARDIASTAPRAARRESFRRRRPGTEWYLATKWRRSDSAAHKVKFDLACMGR